MCHALYFHRAVVTQPRLPPSLSYLVQIKKSFTEPPPFSTGFSGRKQAPSSSLHHKFAYKLQKTVTEGRLPEGFQTQDPSRISSHVTLQCLPGTVTLQVLSSNRPRNSKEWKSSQSPGVTSSSPIFPPDLGQVI